MNKVIFLSSLLLTLWSATPQDDLVEEEFGCTVVECNQPEMVPVDQIVYIEDEEVELGFNPQDYLPDNFDPYASEFEGEEWIYLEDLDIETEFDLEFNAKAHLPKNFDPYAAPAAIK